MKIHKNIAEFDRYLSAKGLTFEAIVIGGAALVMNGTVNRATDDVDILAPQIPDEIMDAAQSFANQRSTTTEKIRDDWLNNGPSKPWLIEQDAHPQWPEHVKRMLGELQRELDKSMSR